MPNIKFTVHCVVKNEDIWVKYAICSVLPYAEKVFIFDTGSTDKTVEVIKTINSPKIIFEQKGPVDPKGLVKLRNEQINRTQTKWFLIVDGDEIWPKKELLILLDAAQSCPENILALVNRNRNSVGDIYHYLPDEASEYVLAGMKGNLIIKMIKKTKDLKVEGEYPLEFFATSKGAIQSENQNLLFVDCWYLHTSLLRRSSKDKTKKSGSFGKSKIWEKGLPIKIKDLPEVLQDLNPNSYQIKKRGFIYELGSSLTTPVIKIKRKIRR